MKNSKRTSGTIDRTAREKRIEQRVERKTQHTPGPWTSYHTGKRFRIDDSEGCMVASIEHVATGDEERILEPNASLIAAAPEMLDALEQFVFWYDQYRPKVSVKNGDDPSGFIENLDFKINRYREIIAKAKGGA